jgi:hypothetical protein
MTATHLVPHPVFAAPRWRPSGCPKQMRRRHLVPHMRASRRSVV